MRSMTAFGQALGAVEGRQVEVEIRCLNHRFCEVRLQGLSGWGEIELQIEHHLRDWVGHGRVDCSVQFLSGTGPAGQPVLDVEMARAYLKVFQELSRMMSRKSNSLTLDLLVQAPGVINLRPGPQDRERALRDLIALIEKAEVQADAMRLREGERLKKELEERLEEVDRLLKELDSMLPSVQEKLRKQMTERLQELGGGLSLEPGRLEQEFVLMLEKCDVREELVRLESHCRQFKEWMQVENQPIGKRLDFLLQEMNREINTLSAKMRSVAVVRAALAVKSEIEKMREQVQNVW